VTSKKSSKGTPTINKKPIVGAKAEVSFRYPNKLSCSCSLEPAMKECFVLPGNTNNGGVPVVVII
jgi:hypothetical protein